MSSRGTHKLITKILWHTKKIYCNFLFSNLTKKIGVILISSHGMAVVVLAVVIFLIDSLREKRSERLMK